MQTKNRAINFLFISAAIVQKVHWNTKNMEIIKNIEKSILQNLSKSIVNDRFCTVKLRSSLMEVSRSPMTATNKAMEL